LMLILLALVIVSFRVWERMAVGRGARMLGLSLAGVQLAVFLFDVARLVPVADDSLAGEIVLALGLFEVGLAASLLWGRSATLLIVMFLILHLLVTGLVLGSSSRLMNDVQVFHAAAAAALVEGSNPYDMTFPDVYPEKESSIFYGPGISVDGVLQFGYPYPPLNLLIALLGMGIGDVRYVFLFLAVLAGAVIWRISGTAVGVVAAVLFLTGPAFLRVTSLGWTEPAIVLALAAAVLAARRRPHLTPWLLGTAIALKQYMVLFAPLYLLFLGSGASRPRWFRDVAIAVGVVVGTGLPFLLMDPDAFLWSVLELQFHQPYRPESLSVLASIFNATGWPPAWTFGILPFLAAGIASALVLRRGDATISGFTVGLVVVNLSFLLVSKQAFANYYFLTIGLAFVAAAASPLDRPPAHLSPVEAEGIA
jgi:hypothetical protein